MAELIFITLKNCDSKLKTQMDASTDESLDGWGGN